MEKFGLGQKTGIDLAGEASGILMDKENVKTVDLARMGFGHAVAVTPIQLLSIVCGILNGGNYMTPSVLESIVDCYGTQLLSNSQTSKGQIVSAETSQKICQMLSKVTNKQGDYTFVEGYDVGGKTGTAQKYDENGQIAQGKYISSFIGTYPASNPEYVVMVMVDEPSAGAYYGSIVASPYGKEILSGIFEYKNIPKDNETVKIEYVEMPDVTGLSLVEASLKLKEQGLYYETDGDGGKVLKQLPPAGTTLAKGDTVVLVT